MGFTDETPSFSDTAPEPPDGHERTSRSPRDFLVNPAAFGGGTVELDSDAARNEPAKAQAAVVQAGIAHTVDRLMYGRGLHRSTLARRAALSQDRLGLLLTGARWAQLHDLVALAAALDHDIVQYAQMTGRELDTEWIPVRHMSHDATGDPSE